MLRSLAGLTIGMYLGFNAPGYVEKCRGMCDRYFEAAHDEAYQKESN